MPFDEAIVKQAVIFMSHEYSTSGSRNRMPKRLPRPLPQNCRFEVLIPEWHGNFLKNATNTINELSDLYSCACFLEIKPLMLLCSAKLANRLQQARSIYQMREALGIKSDFSVDEELQITSGHVGLWDTHAEDMERTMIIKQLQEAAE